jgi:hypothetical protein
MTHLALALHYIGAEIIEGAGLWLFLSVGAIALFGIFLPAAHWFDNRRKEREAYYRAETIRRVTEASSDGAKATVELLREEERIKARKTREGLKIGGLICLGTGVALMIYLHALLGPNGVDRGAAGPVYLSGLIPGLIGVAMLVYVYLMAAPVE